MKSELRIAGSEGGPASESAAYDVCVPGVLPADQIALVETVHRKFLHAWAMDVSDYLQTPVAGEPGGTQQTSFPRFLADRAGDGCVVGFEVTPGPSRMFVSLGAGLVSTTLGLLLGAPAGTPDSGRNTFTEIEIHILSEFFDRLIFHLRTAWSAFGIGLEMLGIQPPTEVEPPSDGDNMLVLGSVLRFADRDEPFYVVLPPLMARLAMSVSRDDSDRTQVLGREDLIAALGRARVEVEAVLTGSTLRMSDLLAMEPGQTVCLGQPANAFLHCRINGISKFRGELIQNRDRVALIIERAAGSTA